MIASWIVISLATDFCPIYFCINLMPSVAYGSLVSQKFSHV